MPRKIGYGNFTPARKAALRKAQLESARKRRKFHSDNRPVRKAAKVEVRTERKTSKKRLALAGAMAAAGGLLIYKGYKDEQAAQQKRRNFEFDLNVQQAIEDEKTNNAKVQAEIDRLKQVAGNEYGACESQEQYDARFRLYGTITAEKSRIHDGRAEIFPGRPEALVLQTMLEEKKRPTYSLDTSGEYTVMYHRTGGGNDLDAEQAAEAIIKEQRLTILNRDEKRQVAGGRMSQEDINRAFKDVWMSNKLNDSNTRAAFGEVVIRVMIPKAAAEQMEQQSFGKLSPGEIWGSINPELLVGAKFERVQPQEIEPIPEPKFKIPPQLRGFGQ